MWRHCALVATSVIVLHEDKVRAGMHSVSVNVTLLACPYQLYSHTCTVSAVRTPDPACGLHRGTVLGDSCISVHSLPQGRSLCLPCYSIPYDAAVAVVRFARTYDMPHASQYIHAYLTAVVKTCFKSKQCAGIIGCFCAQNGAGVGVMADEFNMHDAIANEPWCHCERTMMIYRGCF